MRTEPKAKLMQMAYDIALKNEMAYRSEAQQVLVAIQDALDIRNDVLVKSAMALSGGIAITVGGQCGAVSAGVIAINSLYGRERSDFGKPINYRPYILAKRLCDKFIEVYGSILCADILKKLYGRKFEFVSKEGYVLNKAEYIAFDKAGGHSEAGCGGRLAANAAKWTVEIILDDIEANRGKSGFVSMSDVER